MLNEFAGSDRFDSRDIDERIEELEDTDDADEIEELAELVAFRDDVSSSEWAYGIVALHLHRLGEGRVGTPYGLLLGHIRHSHLPVPLKRRRGMPHDPDTCPWYPCGFPLCDEHGDENCSWRPMDETEEDDGLDFSLSRLPATETGGW
jgi:hypothetical protein